MEKSVNKVIDYGKCEGCNYEGYVIKHLDGFPPMSGLVLKSKRKFPFFKKSYYLECVNCGRRYDYENA